MMPVPKMWSKVISNSAVRLAITSSFIILISTPLCMGKVHKGTTRCENYDRTQCQAGTGPCEPTIEECADMVTSNKVSLDNPQNYMLCYATWIMTNNSSEMQLIKKGCWMNQQICYNERECVDHRLSAPVYFCCCDGDFCNKEFFHRPSGDPVGSDEVDPYYDRKDRDVVRRAGEQQLTETLLCSIVPILGFGFVVVTLFFMWRRHRRHLGHMQLPTVEPTPPQSSLNLQLLELRARGRYGAVWKAQLPDQYVAVKIFPVQDNHSWKAELDIYNLPHMSHENILQFYASEKREVNMCTELLLITEFHEQGSLCDYLKGNTITWSQLCRIGETMTRGLAYLHDEIPATYNSQAKPAIAHRDFKSKNVLLKSDLSACIADFGLALMFEPGKGFSETHPQVGTRRYMAPEVLEGAICFNRDSFLRIDMYACGLIIWELMTRCTSADGPLDEYHLPFEAEVGLQPSLEEMQTLVVTQKCRPAFNTMWYKHLGLNNLIATVEECWDQDAEARLSAGCVQERINQLGRTINSNGVGAGIPDMPSTNPPTLTSSPAALAAPTLMNTTSFVPSCPAVIDLGGSPETYGVNSC